MAERPIIRLTVAAKDAAEFARAAALRLRGEFFAPWDGPVAATVRFEMPFDGTVCVRGEATARAAVVGGRKGVMLRALRLDPDSLQVPLPDIAARPRVPTRNITKRTPTLVPMKSADAAEFAASPVTRPNERLSASLAEELRNKDTRPAPPARDKAPPPPPPAATSEARDTHAAPEAEVPRPPRTEPVPEIPAEVRGRRLPLPTDPPTASRPRPASRRIWLAAAILLAGAGAAAFALTRGGEGARKEQSPRGDTPAATSPDLERHLALADQRLAEGRLTGPGGDAALDHLVAARGLAATDPRVVSRLAALADTFEKLAAGALDAGDLGEAAAHLQAALIADPGRQRAADKLGEIEARVRADQRNR